MWTHCAFAVEEKIDVPGRSWIVVNASGDCGAEDDETVRPFRIDGCGIESSVSTCDAFDFAFVFRKVLAQPHCNFLGALLCVAWACKWSAVGNFSFQILYLLFFVVGKNDLKPSVFLVNVDDEVDGLPEAPMDVTEHIDES